MPPAPPLKIFALSTGLRSRARPAPQNRRSSRGPGRISRGAAGGEAPVGPGRTGGTYMRFAEHNRRAFSLLPQARKVPPLSKQMRTSRSRCPGPPQAMASICGVRPRVGLDKVPHKLARREHQAVVRQADKARRNCDLVIELSGEREVAVDAEPAAGAMLAVLVKDELVARHDVEHTIGHGSRHVAAVGAVAVFRPAPLVLRPQPVQHKGITSVPAGGALRVIARLAQLRAIGRAPRERQHVIIENPGAMLSAAPQSR